MSNITYNYGDCFKDLRVFYLSSSTLDGYNITGLSGERFYPEVDLAPYGYRAIYSVYTGERAYEFLAALARKDKELFYECQENNSNIVEMVFEFDDLKTPVLLKLGSLELNRTKSVIDAISHLSGNIELKRLDTVTANFIEEEREYLKNHPAMKEYIQYEPPIIKELIKKNKLTVKEFDALGEYYIEKGNIRENLKIMSYKECSRIAFKEMKKDGLSDLKIPTIFLSIDLNLHIRGNGVFEIIKEENKNPIKKIINKFLQGHG